MSDLPDPESVRNWPRGKVGYVALVGRPNVGKSTFLNAILGSHLAAVSAKPQTTRRNFLGILSDADSQLIFVDTPGAHLGDSALDRAMLTAVKRSLEDADQIVCLADPTRPPGSEDQLIAERIAATGKGVLLLLNKTDLATPDSQLQSRDFYLERLGPGTPVFPITATDAATLPPVLAALRERLPAGPFFYDAEQLTDVYLRDIGAELIRESLLELLRQEVPHACLVAVEKWQELPELVRVEATIHVETATQKGIVVGQGGRMIREIRKDAEQRLSRLLADDPDGTARTVKLELFVKVSSNWRNQRGFLKDHGLA